MFRQAEFQILETESGSLGAELRSCRVVTRDGGGVDCRRSPGWLPGSGHAVFSAMARAVCHAAMTTAA